MLAAQPVLRTVSVAVRVIGRPGAGVHGHMADSVGATTVISEHYAGQGGVMGRGGAVCKTVGSAYVGSNPTPATHESTGQSLARAGAGSGLASRCDRLWLRSG